MKREIITIGENGKIHIPTITVWMSACEIADLFGVWKSHTNLTHPGKYFRPSKVKIMRPTSPK